MSKSKNKKLTIGQMSPSEMRGIHRSNLMNAGIYGIHKEKAHKDKRAYNRSEVKRVRWDGE